MLLINDHKVKILKTESAAVVLKSNGYSVEDKSNAVYIDGTKYAPESLRRAFVRKNSNCVIEVREEKP